jgi:hypothetical protein
VVHTGVSKEEYKKMIKGTVSKVRQNGRWYSMLVDKTWYGLGSNKPSFSEGQMVQFEASQNGDFMNADFKTIKVMGAGIPTKSAPTASRTVHANEKDDYWRKKEERDLHNDKMREIGAGRNTAIAFVDLLMKNNAIKLPTNTAKAADAIFEAVEYYRLKFEAIASEPVEVKAPEEVEEEQEVEEEDYE